MLSFKRKGFRFSCGKGLGLQLEVWFDEWGNVKLLTNVNKQNLVVIECSVSLILPVSNYYPTLINSYLRLQL